MGVEIYPGFAAAEVLFNDAGAVIGVATGDMGIGWMAKKKGRISAGMELHAKYTLFAGVRGSLSQELMKSSTCAMASIRRSRHRHQKGAVAN